MLSLFSGKQTNSGVRRKDRENRARVWRGENDIKGYYLLEWLSERRTCKLSWGQHRIFHQHQIVILVRTVGQHCEEIICSSAWVSLESKRLIPWFRIFLIWLEIFSAQQNKLLISFIWILYYVVTFLTVACILSFLS